MTKQVNYLIPKANVKYLTLAFLFLCYLTSYSQILKGKVVDSTFIVANATVLIKNYKSKEKLQYTFTDEKGEYFIELKYPKDSLIVEFSSIQYETQSIALSNYPITNDTIYLNINFKDNYNDLDEVVIKTRKRIEIKEDTTTYNIERFKNGSEKTIEDLLKKLPGIKVDEKGVIKFKGKSIKKLLLDGDDLFDSNYTIASKNISVDIVDKIQGVENYEENVLKKGLKNSDEVIINLVLKKGRYAFSGNSSLGYGFNDQYTGNIIGLLINKKTKFYNYASYNNIGLDNTDIFNSNPSNIAKTILSEGNFFSILDNSFHNFNNNFVNSTNVLFKVFKNSNFKVNFNLKNDNQDRFNSNSIEINGVNEILINTTENINKKPFDLLGEVLFSNKENDSLHWNYRGSYKYKNSDLINISNNNDSIQQNNSTSNHTLINNQIDLTYRIDSKRAIETIINHNFSEAPQELLLSSRSLLNNNNILQTKNQNSTFKKQQILAKIDFLGLHKKNSYKIETGYNYIYNEFNSVLNPQNSSNNQNANDFENDNNYKIQNFYISPKYSIVSKKNSVAFGANLQFNDLSFIDDIENNNLNETSFLLLPFLNFKHKISNQTGLSFGYSYNEILPEEDKLFANVVQTDFRNFISNDISLENLRSHNFNFAFKSYNFYERRSIDFGLSYIYNANNYFNNNIINQDTSITNTFLRNIGLNNYAFFLNSEFFLLFLKSTFGLNINYSISEDLNTLNDNTLRNITFNNLQIEFVTRRGFKRFLNFENTFTFSNSTFRSNITNTLNSITNQFKALVKFNNNLEFKSTYNYVQPSLSSRINYNFIEAELSLIPKKSNISYSLTAKNIINERLFESESVTDFSTSISSYNLINRYLLFKIYFSF